MHYHIDREHAEHAKLTATEEHSLVICEVKLWLLVTDSWTDTADSQTWDTRQHPTSTTDTYPAATSQHPTSVADAYPAATTNTVDEPPDPAQPAGTQLM